MEGKHIPICKNWAQRGPPVKFVKRVHSANQLSMFCIIILLHKIIEETNYLVLQQSVWQINYVVKVEKV